MRRAVSAREILTGILGRCLRLKVSSVVDAKPIPAKQPNVAVLPRGDAKVIVGSGVRIQQNINHCCLTTLRQHPNRLKAMIYVIHVYPFKPHLALGLAVKLP